MLRSYPSDPVLVKPSTAEFFEKWNNYDSQTKNDDMDDILIRVIKVDLADIPKDLPKKEREKFQKRIERRARRRYSILMANKHQSQCQSIDIIHRSSSAPDLHTMSSTSNNKRVSFSIDDSSCVVYDSTETLGMNNNIYKVPSSPPRKPILIRKSRAFSTELGHIDFETFNAWRRGSKMSSEVYSIRSRADTYQQKEEPRSWAHPADLLKTLVLQCLSTRRNRTSPVIPVYRTPAY